MAATPFGSRYLVLTPALSPPKDVQYDVNAATHTGDPNPALEWPDRRW